jgi:hypothetical protein
MGDTRNWRYEKWEIGEMGDKRNGRYEKFIHLEDISVYVREIKCKDIRK